ncbi:hypothetical protein [Pseudomonas guariconensis]|nr:hypothetical protein [Pseudomonas guariconensis]MEB3840652.1 hypothetical protein [Pseudomonas guariconensis]MEB3873520.1 hypothetical protein [Pseudomonas guariconensis]MEB3879887.1 hypothetical protein [Pseudomonas guariconensis]MEB3895657.1 hypothetical protein [Pseudomonas guariconensis]
MTHHRDRLWILMEKYFGIALCSLSSVFSGFTVASPANVTPEQEQQIARVSDLAHQLADELEQKKVLVDALNHLEQQVANLFTANQQLSDRQTALVDAQAKSAAISHLNDEASNDARTSYAVGAWPFSP